MLVTADETGVVAGVDLRMLGGKAGQKPILWQSRNPTGGVTCLTVACRPMDGKAPNSEGVISTLGLMW